MADLNAEGECSAPSDNPCKDTNRMALFTPKKIRQLSKIAANHSILLMHSTYGRVTTTAKQHL